MLNILVFVLAESNKADAIRYINKLYPNSKLDILLKKELVAKPILKKITSLRKQKYDLAIVFSDNLEYQTKLHLLKAILLLVRAKERKIVDDKGGEIWVGAGDFVLRSIPALVTGFILSIGGLLFSLIFLNLFLLFLKIKKPRSTYERNGEYFAYIQTTFAFSDIEGGDASYRAGLADGFAALGHKISFLTSSTSQFKGLDNPVHLIKLARTFDSLYDIHKLMYNFEFIWQGGRILSPHRPLALIQYHDPYDFSGAVLASFLKIPFFLDAHDITHWKLSFWHKIQLTYFAKLSEEVCLSAADVILVGSHELENLLKKKATGKNIVVRPNGVNPELFKPMNRGEEIRKKYGINAEVVVGYAGSFACTHGIELLAKAIETILKKHEEIHFLLVGKGDKYSYMKDFIKQKRLGGKVSLAGNIPHHQIPLYLDACDILLAVYIHTDFRGSPMKLFEYMAMEKAVVATTQGQITQIIDSGEDGILIELEDENSLIEAILLLANDKNLRIKMGKRARKKVLENYTWKNTVEKIINAYQEITTETTL